MATSIAAPAPPGAQISPSIPQGPWGGSPAVQSPGLPAHQGPGVGSDAASFFASHPGAPQPPNGVAQPPPTAPSPQTIAPTRPPAGPPSQGSSSNTPGIDSKAPPAPVRSDTAPEAQPTYDKSHTEQYTAIATVMKTAERSVLRQVIRDHWDIALMGSDYNLAFFLNAILHQAPPDVLRRSVQDFGAQLVQAALPQIINRCSGPELDQVTDLLLSKLSPEFLDRALAQRLETIDARSLVNALARAERLGYDLSDIVVERQPDKPEQVVPSLEGFIPPDFPAMNGHYHGPSPHHHPMQGTQSVSSPAPSPTPIQPQSKQPKWMIGLPPLPAKGPHGILYCQDCRRPCSGEMALQHHRKKAACDPNFRIEKIDKNLCTHCGQAFTSNTGLLYHSKVKVCGDYSAETLKQMNKELSNYVKVRETRLAAMPANVGQTPTQISPQQKFSALKPQVRRLAEQQHSFLASQSQNGPPATPQATSQAIAQPQGTPQPRSGRKDDDAYAHLNPDALKRFQGEMLQAEEKYGQLFRETLLLPIADRQKDWAKWKNCYNTKQSMTRKKYGIRLRERRTQEEIDSERRRMLGPDGPEIWATMEQTARDAERLAKRPRTDGDLSSQNASPLPPPSSGTPQPNQALTPRKRVALADMGGLSGSIGSAEMTDPTTLLTSSQPRGLAQLHQNQAQVQTQAKAQAQAQANGSEAPPPGSTQNEPMTIAEDSSNDSSAASNSQPGDDQMSTDSDDDGSGGDIQP